MSGNPVLCGDFCLIPVAQRQGWRDSAAKHLLGQARDENQQLLSEWKRQEQLGPARQYIALQLAAGVESLSAIVATYMTIEETHPSYARSEESR